MAIKLTTPWRGDSLPHIKKLPVFILGIKLRFQTIDRAMSMYNTRYYENDIPRIDEITQNSEQGNAVVANWNDKPKVNDWNHHNSNDNSSYS
ncbi:MAG TPA: hypothetical protein VMR49_03740 [Candidatus Paceibacterota bacterium]|nr:hypothetical protein [Candidatus Paceibacterota bacterium]